MERLTKRQAFTVGGVIYAKCEHCQDKRPECFGEQCPVPDEALISLAAYEDTGLSPADIATLTARAEAAEAERDAAVEDLKRFSACCQCNANIDGSCCDMFDGTAENKYFCSNWQWRGPVAEKGDAPNE